MKTRKGCHMVFKCRNGQKWNKQDEGSGNPSSSQLFRCFTILLLTLVFVSGCDSPSTPKENNVQNSSTPLPTIVARNSGNQQPFCNGTVNQTAWSGLDNVFQVLHEVPAPVPPGFIAGYSVGDFAAPCSMPKVGVVRMEAFIATRTAFDYFYGNDRDFSPLFNPEDTKVSIILDFTKGEAQVTVDPTCHQQYFIGTEYHRPNCARAYTLTGTKADNVNWFRWKVDPPLPGFPSETEFLTIQYAFKLPIGRADLKFALAGIPAINGVIHFAFEPSTGDVCLKGTIDDFPAVGVHQVHYRADGQLDPTTAITLARHQEARVGGPVWLVSIFPQAHISNQCGQSLTGSSPTPSLEGVDWTKVITEKELGCQPPAYPSDPHGVQVDVEKFADVTGDGNPEAFVAVACVGATESWPDRLEVFDGASDPAHPQRIATLLDYQDGTDGPQGLGLRIQSIQISGEQVTVVSKGWLPGQCFACGDRRVTDTFTWNGSSFTRGPRSVTQMT